VPVVQTVAAVPTSESAAEVEAAAAAAAAAAFSEAVLAEAAPDPAGKYTSRASRSSLVSGGGASCGRYTCDACTVLVPSTADPPRG